MDTTMKSKRLASFIMVCMMILGIMNCSGPGETYAASSVVIGHAASGESGLKNQKAGDQTGKEVYTMSWVYSSSSSSARHWTVVIRAKDPKIAKKMAQTMQDACANEHVGYDKVNAEQRNSFFNALKAANWDATKVTKNVECSCTPLIGACINAAGIEIDPDRSASSLYNLLKKDSRFICYTTSDYYASDKKLVAGDILLSTGSHQHGAMVVSSPNSAVNNAEDKVTASDSTESTYKKGINYITTEDLCIRYGPGTSYEIKSRSELTEDGQKHSLDQTQAVLKKDTIVTCVKSSGDWIKIPSGWICGKSGNDNYVRLCTKQDIERKEAEEAAEKKAAEEAAAKKAAEEKAAAEAAAKKAAEEKAAADAAAKKAAEEAAAKKTTLAATATKTTTAKTTTTKDNKSTVIGGLTIKVGKDYTLAKALNVRKGPGTKYARVKRSKLSASAKKSSKKGTYAVFKKNTAVTCLEIKGDWIRVPSGWICAKAGNLKGQKVVKTTTASSSSVTVKKGKTYKLSKDLNVRTGAGTNYAIKSYKDLSADAKKNAVNQSQAKLKKGTIVTCLEVKGDWMKIPSGWICCKPGNVTAG